MSRKQRKSQARRKSSTPAASGELRQIAEIQSQLRGAERSFDPDYSEVINDLKRIGVLAGFFISVLVVLSFFLG